MSAKETERVRKPGQKRSKPVFGVVCVICALWSIAVPLLFFDSSFGDAIELQNHRFISYVVAGLAGISIVRRERIVWAIIGIILACFYEVLHLIPGG
jgi:hypothetical protein